MKTQLLYSTLILICGFLLCCSNLNAQCSSTCPELITNGNFSAGNTGFNSGLPFSTACTNETYSIVTNANQKCAFFLNVTDHTSGNGDFMVVDSREPSPNSIIWAQGVNVIAGVTYEFSYWVYPNVSGGGTNSGPTLQFRVNGSVVSTNDLSNTLNPWNQECITWTATTTGSVNIEIFESTANDTWNDYGLDDFSFRARNCTVDPCEVGIEINHSIEGCKLDLTGTTVNVFPPTEVLSTTWTFGDGFSSTDLNPTHLYKQPDFYTVCLTVVTYNPNTQECCVTVECIDVAIKEECPIDCHIEKLNWISEVDDCCNYTFTGQVTSQTNILGWFWDFGDGTTGSENVVEHVFPGAGNYTVCVTVVTESSNGCCVETFCQEIEVNCKGAALERKFNNSTSLDLNKRNATDFKVYPNPSFNQLTVEYKLSKEQSVEITLLDIQGKQVKTIVPNESKPKGIHKMNIDTSDLPEGVYLVRVMKNGLETNKKVIIQE